MLEGCVPFPEEFTARYIRDGFWRPETIARAIAQICRQHPARTALRDESRAISYRELLDESAAIGAILAGRGLGPGDRIVVQLPNCIEFATLLLACLHSGVIPVMALPAYRRAELEYLVNFSAARAIAIAPQYRGFDHVALARDLIATAPILESILATAPASGCVCLRDGSLSNARHSGRIGSAPAGDPFDVALFLLSGGTTGLPKLIPRTHADFLYNASASAEVAGLDSESRFLIALPASHNFALACPGLLGALLSGACTIFTQAADPAGLAAVIERERITHFPCVPTFALGLLELAEAGRADLTSLRVLQVGGAKLKEATARRLRAVAPRLHIQQVFGMSEGLICYTRLDDPDDIAFTTQGRPLSAADELRIVDESGRELPDGELGELWCRGPYTIRGYYRAPDRNREAFSPDGFYKTGDLVRRDSGGNLIVEGRIKDLVNRGGEKISAEEIEGHLAAHPDLLNAAVVPMPDERLGERACLYVVLKPGAMIDLDGLRSFLDARGVARFKWPERIEVIAAMPATGVGKIKKSELRSDIERKLASERAARRA